jgi:hypothetical protein
MKSKSRHVPVNYSSIVAIPAVGGPVDTSKLFQAGHDDSSLSPIDQFIENTLPLNLMWVSKDKSKHLERFEGVLLVLGYVSAVESFMRALIRRILVVDLHSMECCQALTVSFSAAKIHTPEMLPDALLEEQVFSGEKGITTGLTKFLNVAIHDAKLKDLIAQYDNICEVRHCCVHRFGKLGTKNAVALGLETHQNLIEKPVELTYDAIESIANLVATMAKGINNEVMAFVLKRSATSRLKQRDKVGIGWTWKETIDKPRYASYYSIFASIKEAAPSAPASVMYRLFKATFKKAGSNRS